MTNPGGELQRDEPSSVPTPRLIEIQPTARCHRTCAFCSHLVRNQSGAELSSEVIRAILDDARGLGTRLISFSGGGEPLYWSRGDLASLAAAAAVFASVSLTTSGDQLWDPRRRTLTDLAERLLPACDHVLVNVPAADEATYARIVKGGLAWADVRRLLESLVAARGVRHSSEIICVVVVTRDNLHQIEGIDHAFAEIGVTDVYYKPFKVYEERRPARKVETSAIASTIGAMDAATLSLGLRRLFAPLSRDEPAAAPCRANREGLSAVVDPEGRLFLCTPTVGRSEYAIGNVTETSLRRLWSAEAHLRVLGALDARAAGNRCPSECRYRPYNASALQGGPPVDVAMNAGLENATLLRDALRDPSAPRRDLIRIRRDR
jgi:radical SAM protein with 4Fe4S-binding SPASM domain